MVTNHLLRQFLRNIFIYIGSSILLMRLHLLLRQNLQTYFHLYANAMRFLCNYIYFCTTLAVVFAYMTMYTQLKNKCDYILSLGYEKIWVIIRIATNFLMLNVKICTDNSNIKTNTQSIIRPLF